MEAQTATAKINDQILGYQLNRKIGSGGFGDVWEAEAPGGLKKALKIVYGFCDERRAQAELKALDRIKEARHPFLLSLERIEIFNSQLVVVSELADKSLADLANEYRSNQGEGIPREELVKYMIEAADALDYLNREFQLQHLDIKPENILLIAGHAKVADFGLVKDINNQTQSLVSGMTPAYAAPELFDGQPGPASDQYSLAVVYQEMLTTARPFHGGTTAQLAAQHLHGKPDLRLLPIGDQPVIATALNKNPAERYSSCGEFVAKLLVSRSRKKSVRSHATVREAADTSSNTAVVSGEDSSVSFVSTDVISSHAWRYKSADVQSFDPPDCDPQSAEFQPTLVIAVGESSANAARKFKERLTDRFGALDNLPSIRFLCIDADQDSLSKLNHHQGGCSLGVHETLAIPLRRPEQYRRINNLDLSWLSRRWIYNVPRNLKIDGLRPLGRLVFADHFTKICDGISDCLKKITPPEHVASSCQTLEMNPPQELRPNVILISNISGGIGSGMTNDLAYTIRLMLAENGFGEATLTGILMHGVKAGRDLSLATANSYAYLCELRHFADRGYPGDSRLGIPEFEEDLPFDFTYGLRLSPHGDEKNSHDLDRIADYLLLSTSTACSAFIEAARAREQNREEFALRSFGIGTSGLGEPVHGSRVVEEISQGVIDHWLKGPDDSFDSDQFVKTLVDELHLEFQQVQQRVTSTIVDTPDWQTISENIENARKLHLSGDPGDFPGMTRFFDELYGKAGLEQRGDADSTTFSFALEPQIVEIGQQVGDEICDRIFKFISGNEINFAVVDAAFDSWTGFVDRQLLETNRFNKDLGRQFDELRCHFDHSADDQTETDATSVEFVIEQYSTLRLQEFASRNSHHLYRIVKGRLALAEETIQDLKLQLESIAQQFHPPIPDQRSHKSYDVGILMLDRIRDRYESMVGLAQRIAVEKIAMENPHCDGFMETMQNSVALQTQLPATIRSVARSVMWRELKQLCIDELLSTKRVTEQDTKQWLGDLLNTAAPFVTDCGGASTLLLAHPRHSRPSRLPEFIHNTFNTKTLGFPATSGSVVACFEVEGILLANFAFSILKDAPEATELAKRIHTRDDIKWTSLKDLL